MCDPCARLIQQERRGGLLQGSSTAVFLPKRSHASTLQVHFCSTLTLLAPLRGPALTSAVDPSTLAQKGTAPTLHATPHHLSCVCHPRSLITSANAVVEAAAHSTAYVGDESAPKTYTASADLCDALHPLCEDRAIQHAHPRSPQAALCASASAHGKLHGVLSVALSQHMCTVCGILDVAGPSPHTSCSCELLELLVCFFPIDSLAQPVAPGKTG